MVCPNVPSYKVVVIPFFKNAMHQTTWKCDINHVDGNWWVHQLEWPCCPIFACDVDEALWKWQIETDRKRGSNYRIWGIRYGPTYKKAVLQVLFYGLLRMIGDGTHTGRVLFFVTGEHSQIRIWRWKVYRICVLKNHIFCKNQQVYQSINSVIVQSR